MLPKQSFESMFPAKYSPSHIDSPKSLSKNILEQLISEKSSHQSEELYQNTKAYKENKNDVLRVFDGSYQPSRITFRDKEEQEIQKFIDDCISDKLKCRCLLLTGMPGAGKTLLSRRLLEKRSGITVKTVNANTMHNIVEDLSMLLVGAKLSVHRLIDNLKEKKRADKIFICIDEFDSVFKKETSEILNLFQIFCSPVQNVSLIGTSNTMEMINNLTTKYKLSLPDFENIVFKPYTNQEMKKIIQGRIQEIKEKSDFNFCFEDVALKYTATKLSNIKGGDLRHAFGQVRAILSMALDEAKEKNQCVVKFEHASKVLIMLNKAIQGSDLIENLPFQYRLILAAVYLVYEREQCLEAPLKKLDKEMGYIQKTLHLQSQPQRLSEMLKFLSVYGFMTTRQKKKEIHICLKIDLESIKRALEDDYLLGRFFWQ